MFKKLFQIQVQLCANKSTNNVITIRNIFNSKCLFQTVTPKAGSNSNLYKLRKSTGYAMSKCKEALEKNNNSIQEATKWLDEQAQKEGWTKADKLKNRQAAQGSLVFYSDRENNRAILAELNCETDFVAKNEKFLDLSTTLAKSVLKNTTKTLPKNVFKKDDLYKLPLAAKDENRTIGDEIALSIGSIGENMILRRAIVFNLNEKEQLAWYMHGSSESLNGCHFGKYGAMLTFSLSQKNENFKPFDIGRQVAQHIVGMKPLSIGELPKEDVKEKSETKIDENETRLLYQEFIMKPETRVLDFLVENNLVVHDFIRFQCGEILENEDNQ